ncbi:hypothetical protein DL93DRAFT_2091136, partial [Clavulina sp. PMI_390]
MVKNRTPERGSSERRHLLVVLFTSVSVMFRIWRMVTRTVSARPLSPPNDTCGDSFHPLANILPKLNCRQSCHVFATYS